MEAAYDHIQEAALDPTESAENGARSQEQSGVSALNTDFQEAYKAISSSPWGAKLGGFFGSVVKQGETFAKEAQQELSAVSEEATKGFTGLRSQILNRTRSLSGAVAQTSGTTKVGEQSVLGDITEATDEDKSLAESEGVLARLQLEASKRLKDIQKAEDAADEALLKFGTNIRNFLRDAVSIAPPSSDQQGGTVLFESKDASGKRAIHTTRFDAQLHVIHNELESFTKDPVSAEYEPWTKEFDVEKKTDDVSRDLEKYPDLRSAMEKVVPDRVAYVDFWTRYYFLRHSIETAEARRKDLLKGAAQAEEEVGWDEESDDESPDKSTLEVTTSEPKPASVESSAATIHPPVSKEYLQPKPSRRSNDEKSLADSEASYDLVGQRSGAPSHAPGSPRELGKGEDSEEEDWE